MNEILSLLERHGPAIVLVTAFLEQIGAPVTAIPVLIVAGAVAANHGDSVIPLLVLAFAGAILADSIWFFLGRGLGTRVLGWLCRISLSPDSCVRQTETFFDRWGMRSLLFAKFIPGFSIIAPPLAGTLPQASYARFLLYDAAGALIWAGSALGIGVIFRNAIDKVMDALAQLGGWSLVVLVAAVVLFILWKWWERRRFYLALRTARVDVPELLERIRSGHPPTILDVRSESAQKRDRRRIPGALMVTQHEMDERLRTLDPGAEIVLYCT